MHREWPQPLTEMTEPDRTAVVVRGLQALLAEETWDPDAAKDALQVLEAMKRLIDRRYGRAAAHASRMSAEMDAWIDEKLVEEGDAAAAADAAQAFGDSEP